MINQALTSSSDIVLEEGGELRQGKGMVAKVVALAVRGGESSDGLAEARITLFPEIPSKAPRGHRVKVEESYSTIRPLVLKPTQRARCIQQTNEEINHNVNST
jgi:hypothetical protein